MSTATAEATAAPPTRKRSMKKRLVLLALVLALGGGGAGAWLWLHGHAASEAGASAQQSARKSPPAFFAMENFVVNLADKEWERFAQIGITLELDGPATADKLKAYTPVIRSQVLMLLAHKTSAELLERSGKEQLAADIVRETLRAIGEQGGGGPAAQSEAAKGEQAKSTGPVVRVHFSSFIIQ
ncbi:flagellar basal body-associated FliL family protein [Ramlibacter sp. 2FC]|uniref:flagellar basal body-associated FliL family protein n=1 Tax=Ramlibacter sp. 2FC TaxID=2502188 RepID=UPI001484ED99|nr:flagellar basal body-associated FliL family protein [Ramlibacter sp. 2FC]